MPLPTRSVNLDPSTAGHAVASASRTFPNADRPYPVATSGRR